VKHVPDGGLSRLNGIPMRPDRLVGLKNTTRYRQSALARASDGEYMPTENRNLLLPFLILEAKREKGAPGFRAIEMQTAFPIRSLLNLQDKLKRDSRRVLHPLVWFFGFQGDIWRLYAGTVRQDEIVSPETESSRCFTDGIRQSTTCGWDPSIPRIAHFRSSKSWTSSGLGPGMCTDHKSVDALKIDLSCLVSPRRHQP
jgi:hypothetical protein